MGMGAWMAFGLLRENVFGLLFVQLVCNISNLPDGLRKTIFFPQDCASAIQGHPRSLILVPISSAYATFY